MIFQVLLKVGLVGTLLVVLVLSYEAFTHYELHPPQEFELAYRGDVNDVLTLNVADINRDGRLDIFTGNHYYSSETLINVSPDNGGILFKQQRSLFPQQYGITNAESFSKYPIVAEGTIGVFWVDRKIVIANRTIKKVSVVVSSLGPFYVDAPPPEDGEFAKEEMMHFKMVSVPAGVDRSIAPQMIAMPVNLQFSTKAKEILRVGHDQLPTESSDLNIAIGDRHGSVFADLNHDGIGDLLSTRGGLQGRIERYSDKVHLSDELFIGRGDGTFVHSNDLLPKKKNCASYHVGAVDLNEDNLLDLVLGCARKVPYDMFYQDSSGKFSRNIDARLLRASGYFYAPFTYFEFDGDPNSLESLFMDGRYLTLNSKKSTLWSGFIDKTPYVFVNFDLNMDGYMDVFILDLSSKNSHVLINQQGKSMKLQPVSDFGLPPNMQGFTGADIDNDGNQDVFVPPYGVYRWHGDGYEPLTEPFIRKLSIRTIDATWADFDGDGYLDLAVAVEYRRPIWRQIIKYFVHTDWEETVKGEVFVFRNKSENNQRQWLQVSVDCDQGTYSDVYSRIELYDKDGNLVVSSTPLTTSDSRMGQGHYRRYFTIGPEVSPPIDMVATVPGAKQYLNISGFNQRYNLGKQCAPQKLEKMLN